MTNRMDEAAKSEKRVETALYHLVVVGSSAGGIEALSTLVAALPANFPAPIVLAQHLDPTYPSHLGEFIHNQAMPGVERLHNGSIPVVKRKCGMAVVCGPQLAAATRVSGAPLG
jgi:chemotaxis response regulator CheB